MKKLIIFLLAVVSLTSVFAETKIIIASGLDEKNMPKDKLTEIPFDKDKEYIMFVYNDDNTPFNAEKVFFEINTYDDETEKYTYSDMYTVNVKPDWGYCFKGILFNTPLKLKLRVFTDNAELATKYIDVVK